MPFGLENIAPNFDVVLDVVVGNNHIQLSFITTPPLRVHIDLEALGQLDGYHVTGLVLGACIVTVHDHSILFQVAERLASSLETDYGLKVERKVLRHLQPTEQVQSFILA